MFLSPDRSRVQFCRTCQAILAVAIAHRPTSSKGVTYDRSRRRNLSSFSYRSDQVVIVKRHSGHPNILCSSTSGSLSSSTIVDHWSRCKRRGHRLQATDYRTLKRSGAVHHISRSCASASHPVHPVKERRASAMRRDFPQPLFSETACSASLGFVAAGRIAHFS